MDKYNSRTAKLLAKINKYSDYAITISSTCTLYSTPIVSDDWRAHEEEHKRQFKEEGWIKFVVKYFYYNLTKGYQNNPYEISARKAAERPNLQPSVQT
jgi:hypothetical protein